jgi:hypothetical protein
MEMARVELVGDRSKRQYRFEVYDSYNIKDALRSDGYKFDGVSKCWYTTLDESDEETLRNWLVAQIETVIKARCANLTAFDDTATSGIIVTLVAVGQRAWQALEYWAIDINQVVAQLAPERIGNYRRRGIDTTPGSVGFQVCVEYWRTDGDGGNDNNPTPPAQNGTDAEGQDAPAELLWNEIEGYARNWNAGVALPIEVFGVPEDPAEVYRVLSGLDDWFGFNPADFIDRWDARDHLASLIWQRLGCDARCNLARYIVANFGDGELLKIMEMCGARPSEVIDLWEATRHQIVRDAIEMASCYEKAQQLIRQYRLPVRELTGRYYSRWRNLQGRVRELARVAREVELQARCYRRPNVGMLTTEEE